MHRVLRNLVLAALAGAVAAPASAFLASTGQRVEPRSGTDFHVSWGGRSGAPAFWCSAGEYVWRELNLATSTAIYRASPPPRRSGEGIVFSLRPEASSGATGLLRLPQGGGLTAGAALAYCELERMRIFD